MRKVFLAAICLLIASQISGCGSSGRYLPKHQPDTSVDVSKIPNAIPRHERKGRYGNPNSYVVFGKRYYVLDSSRGYVDSGIASWYGPNFHGKKTSSQETYDMYKMTAAHKTLPIPCYVEVTNLNNGRSIIVRVNDRGPFHEGRIIDLSYVAAKKLDIIGSGTGRVEVRVVDPSNPQAHRRQRQVRQRQAQRSVQAPVRSRDALPKTPHVRTPSANVSNTRQAERAQPERNRQPIGEKKELFVQLGAFSTIENAQKFRDEIQEVVHRTVSIATIHKDNKPLFKVRIGPVVNTEAASIVVEDLNAAGHYEHHVIFQ